MESNEKIQILSDLIQFDSRNGNERPVAEYLKACLKNMALKRKSYRLLLILTIALI